MGQVHAISEDTQARIEDNPGMEIRDKWLRIIGVPIIASIMSMIFKFEIWYDIGSFQWVKGLGIALFMTICIWEVNRYIFIRMRKKYPGYNNTRRRIIVQSIVSFLYTMVTSITLDFLVHNTIGAEFDKPYSLNYFSCALISLAPVIFMTAIYESVYFFNELKIYIRQNEAMARMNLQMQFETLKKQLDPHFLFNSLNTLASLIDLENQPAQHYLERLSDVYRYVLETRDKNTVTVREELNFLEAYVYLIKVRFRENLVVNYKLPESIYDKHIPAFSLQLLVENAIKHNIISRDKPLTISVTEAGGNIIVENNKQIKTSLNPQSSTRVGLQNIINRYRLLTSEQIEIFNGENNFKVSLPVLAESKI